MSISMYDASVPVFTQMLNSLVDVLQKAADYAEAKKIDPGVLIASRLYPDMLPLSAQVQIAGDTAKGCAARLAGMEPPGYEDNESSFPELIARLEKTVDYLKTITRDQVEGSEQKTIHYPHHGDSSSMDGLRYLLHRSLPNFFFHVTTAYAILRHNGLEIGKADFMGKY